MSSTGTMVFQGSQNYLPRVGEEIRIYSSIYVVDKIRYVVQEGTHNGVLVQMFLSLVN
jgi:hypothetical protein